MLTGSLLAFYIQWLLCIGATTVPVDFRKQIYPILEAHCFRCHNAQKQLGGFRADIPDNYFRNRKDPFIVPGSSGSSALIEIISGDRPYMKSANAHLLSWEEIDLVKKWINEGAEWKTE